MDRHALISRQDEILKEVAAIRSMKKGSVSMQRMGSTTDARAATYPVLTWKEQGRTKGMRLKSEQEVAWAQAAIEQHKRYTALCREYEELAEQLALLQRDADATASEAVLKKGLKSLRSNARK